MGKSIPLFSSVRFDDSCVGLRSSQQRCARGGWGVASEYGSVDGEHCEPEFWQRNGEYADDAVVDADVDRDSTGDGQLSCGYRGRLYDCGRHPADDSESASGGDAAGTVQSNIGWGSQWADRDCQQLRERQPNDGGTNRDRGGIVAGVTDEPSTGSEYL